MLFVFDITPYVHRYKQSEFFKRNHITEANLLVYGFRLFLPIHVLHMLQLVQYQTPSTFSTLFPMWHFSFLSLLLDHSFHDTCK